MNDSGGQHLRLLQLRSDGGAFPSILELHGRTRSRSGREGGVRRNVWALILDPREAAGLLVSVSADLRFCLNSSTLEKVGLCRDSCSMDGIDRRTNTAARGLPR